MGSQFRTNFAGDFKKMQKSARRAAGREIGSAVVRQRIEALVDNNHTRIGGGVRRNSKNNSHRNSLNSGGAISSRRKKAVRSIVGADGTLVVLDLFPHAEQLETGKTITSSKKCSSATDVDGHRSVSRYFSSNVVRSIWSWPARENRRRAPPAARPGSSAS